MHRPRRRAECRGPDRGARTRRSAPAPSSAIIDTGRQGRTRFSCPALSFDSLNLSAWPAETACAILTGNFANACRLRPGSIQSPRRELSGNYRKRDDGDHEVLSTTTDHCRWIRASRSLRHRRSPSSRCPRPRPTPLASCPGGEEPDLYTSAAFRTWCPTAGSPYSAIAGNPDLAAVNLPGGGGSIPCTGHNTGQCIGLAEEQQCPVVTPRVVGRQQPDRHRSPKHRQLRRARRSRESAYMVV